MKNSIRRILKPQIWITGSLLFGTGLFIGWELKDLLYPSAIKEQHEGQYQFINPLLACEGGEELISRELTPFKDKLESLIQEKVAEKKISSAAVYFRDLNNGPWIGINEKEPFLPGSLLKVPVMMAYFKKAETDPSLLEKKIVYDRDIPPSGQLYKPAFRLERGKTYSVKELIHRMIVYSDNEATYLLQLHLMDNNEDFYRRVYNDLGIPAPDGIHLYRISVKKYASFFRILFNASYLGQEASNKALSLLSETDFHEGIVAGLPSNVTAAQKFGESKSDDNQKQFHDCGIVYYPGHPYLLCVMTRGNDYQNLVPVIRDISKLTFGEVNKQMQHYKRR